MPRMSGVELAETMHALAPRLKVLFVSGYAGGTSEDITPPRTSLPGSGFLQKPFQTATLAYTIRQLLDAADTSTDHPDTSDQLLVLCTTVVREQHST